jgi:hypothetical protein
VGAWISAQIRGQDTLATRKIITMNEKMKMKGVVKWSGGNEKWGKKLWSFTLNGEDGFFGCGISDPKVKKGDTIEFDYEIVNGRASVVVDSINLLSSAPSDRADSYGGSGGQPGKANGGGGGNAQYWEDKTKRDIENDDYRRANDIRIQYQSARNAAITVTDLLVKAGAIIIPEKKGSGYDVIMGKIEDLTNEFFQKCSAVGEKQENA